MTNVDDKCAISLPSSRTLFLLEAATVILQRTIYPEHHRSRIANFQCFIAQYYLQITLIDSECII